MQAIPQDVLDAYSIGDDIRISPVKTGWIHQTYKVTSSEGAFILQRLHAILASSAIASDFLAVTRALAERGVTAPTAILSTSGDVLVHHGDYAWRMQSYIEGQTHETITSNAMARSLGSAYGQFHMALRDLTYDFQTTHPLHETDVVLDAFEETMRHYEADPLMASVHEEVTLIRETLPTLLLPTDLPTTVIHGDPKISNILFDGTEVKAIIDLDTCNRKSPLFDLGDAFRSWCGGKEDDPQNTFNLDYLQAAWSGYREGSQSLLNAREIALVPQAVQLITLELAARFLTDYFKDTYFGFDAERYTTRREHNLARARGQIALYRDQRKKSDAIQSLLK